MTIFESAILGPELILLGAIALALGLTYAYLRTRAQLDLLRRVWLPTLLWSTFGSLDALVTMAGTWGAPQQEGNPSTRAFLYLGGWLGLTLKTFLFVLFWAALVIGLEALRRRLGGAWAHALGAAQLLILYALAMGHLYGFLSWTPAFFVFHVWRLIDYLYVHARWIFTTSPLGSGLYIGLALGSLCTALHLTLAAILGRRAAVHPRVASTAMHGKGEGAG
jgi:hypothetical protein